MNQNKMPIYEALMNLKKERIVPFDVPGHKLGHFVTDLSRKISPAILAYDANAPLGLDNLYHPTSVIKESENLAAKAFHADHCLFSINGTSGGILSMFLACLDNKDKIILPRNSHKSVIFVKVKDMETKKFKPFDVEAAKAGDPVCTRDGRPARIICFNRVSDKFPIIALVMNTENREDVYYYDNNGKDCHNKEKDYDLVMKPKIKTGWINVHKENGLYKTEEDAINNRPNDDFIPVKIEFEI